MLASRFRNVNAVRSETALTDDQIRAVVPSAFAQGAHDSRSERYAYIPTCDVLAALRREGFEPFAACQTRVRKEDKIEHTKHMIRLRHASEICNVEAANEIILLNSHDGTSSYQMLAGKFRFVCANGLVRGDTSHDIRVRHSGDVVGHVIEGAYTVLEGFKKADEEQETMQGLLLSHEEQEVFARAALALRYDEDTPAPVTESQILAARRYEDRKADLWHTFNRVHENLMKGKLRGRNALGRPVTTREVGGIDQGVKLNRALWLLADGMAKLKGGA